MVYRGRSGAGPEKKGEDVFPLGFVVVSLFASPTTKIWAGPVSCQQCRAQNTFRETYTSNLEKGYSPTDVLLNGWSPADRCARCTLSQVYVVISAWRCFALIIRNPSDNQTLRVLAHLVDPLLGGRGTPAGSPWALRAQAGGRARPPGGSKLSPPGDGRHLTDFVAN